LREIIKQGADLSPIGRIQIRWDKSAGIGFKDHGVSIYEQVSVQAAGLVRRPDGNRCAAFMEGNLACDVEQAWD